MGERTQRSLLIQNTIRADEREELKEIVFSRAKKKVKDMF